MGWLAGAHRGRRAAFGTGCPTQGHLLWPTWLFVGIMNRSRAASRSATRVLNQDSPRTPDSRPHEYADRPQRPRDAILTSTGNGSTVSVEPSPVNVRMRTTHQLYPSLTFSGLIILLTQGKQCLKQQPCSQYYSLHRSRCLISWSNLVCHLSQQATQWWCNTGPSS